MEETLTERRKPFAAPVIFILVFLFHFVSKYLESYKKKKGSMNNVDVQLREEIKQLLKEASSLSQDFNICTSCKTKKNGSPIGE